MMTKRKKQSKSKTVLFLAIIVGAVVLFLYYYDWRGEVDRFKARQYKPTAEIASLESSLNLTDRGRNLLYALSPKLENADKFNEDCANVSGVESGFLLGCYSSTRQGENITIFNAGAHATAEQRELFDYDSSRIVTTAHEMLHGAYERRKWQDISSIDQEIQEVITQIEGNCQSMQPLAKDDCQILAADMENYTSLNRSELYARLGTEIYQTKLPPSLARDYSRYFNDTTSIVNRFRKNRQQEIDIKAKIETLRAELEYAERNVNNLVQQYYAHPTYDGYYSTNAKINRYNQQVEEYNNLIRLYNSTFVEQLNSKSPQSLSQ